MWMSKFRAIFSPVHIGGVKILDFIAESDQENSS